MAVCLLYEDVTAGLSRASARARFFAVSLGFALLALFTCVAYATGQQMAEDIAAGQSPSLTMKTLLTKPPVPVTISAMPPATDIAPEQGALPQSGLLLATDGSTAYLWAERKTWRVPESTVVIISGG
jgi:hypothetical protein